MVRFCLVAFPTLTPAPDSSSSLFQVEESGYKLQLPSPVSQENASGFVPEVSKGA